MECKKMEMEDKINQLIEKTMEIDEKLTFITEKLEDLTSWVDGAAYAWDKFAKKTTVSLPLRV